MAATLIKNILWVVKKLLEVLRSYCERPGHPFCADLSDRILRA